jgi:hypothetical protein
MVQIRVGPLAGRWALVKAIVPTWGDHVVLALKFEKTKIDFLDDQRRPRITYTHPSPYWPPEHVVPGAHVSELQKRRLQS